jgi:hypothetical protein
MDVAYTTTLDAFYFNWMWGTALAQCINIATNQVRNGAAFFAPCNKTMHYSGENPYTDDIYDFTISNCITSPIYVVGHSGLTRTGVDPNFENKYVSKVDK